MNLPVEALELAAPIRVHRFALRRDSGGPVNFAVGSAFTASTKSWRVRSSSPIAANATSVRPEGARAGWKAPDPTRSSDARRARRRSFPRRS